MSNTTMETAPIFTTMQLEFWHQHFGPMTTKELKEICQRLDINTEKKQKFAIVQSLAEYFQFLVE